MTKWRCCNRLPSAWCTP